MEKVWIYQANRFFTANELELLRGDLSEFVKQWTAHGDRLLGSFEIKYNLFIILKVDESQAMVTGCSIDKSVHLLKDIASRLNIDLFDRTLIAYRLNSNTPIELVSRDQFERLIREGIVNEKTTVFNNLLTNGEEFTTKWEVSLKDSWHGQVFLG
ncbi:ABC transporter ATPase [Sphingobacterium sp. UT-1RO-CII-1]|uniref:ABC transporter ATPase n=1 Tax=Sphingobacterium sp. UT-1RO-CII-1 TaxID=2995225 RepID=UPI00227AFD11|nr:ABC transporter ATPase [Sphingobacterium sp. UT-1RO-CII-1]MCY4778246.1 ABC transporter ATPase [Sphingobacterium sp. UT-1RO-CII-1]